MKATIQLDRPIGAHSLPFTSTDYVSGTVHLILHRDDAVSRITLELSGTLHSCVVAVATNPLDGTLEAVDSHKLFEKCLTIFPPRDIPISPKGFSLSKGTRAFPFQIRLPILSTCHSTKDWIAHCNTTLPPSFKVQVQNNVARSEMKYYLKVKIERPGRFRPDITELQELKFTPLDPSLPPPMLRSFHSKGSRYLSQQPVGASTSLSRTTVPRLDSRMVTLEATLPSPAIIYTKGSLPLKVSAVVEQGATHLTPPIWLYTLYVILRTELTVTVGPNSTTWPVLHELINVSGLDTELQNEPPVELNDDLWKDCVVPDVTPSFTTCTHMQQHFLVVTGGFSYGDNGPIQTIKTTINIDIHSGMKPAPNLTDGGEWEQAMDSEQLPFIPWRLGSERHLGILGRSSSMSRRTPPPVYY
ncbi:uncharacterized protein PAC_11543 [Phialocephala subalpina]|uniref:Arrestin-like N-terminal domain-containing protein n=1 Tax=Phialocephala subalpina TaxID=576137 RepID=A0A1L7X9H7_9HELO|nr:uncharacterized protein PAC_11543 [Phialocephala subalpina]